MSNRRTESSPDSLPKIVGNADPQTLRWRPLEDLSPRYVPSMHAGYLRALLEGVESQRATNIALSGPYGAGKSSILEGLASRFPDQTVQVSLATVRSASAGAADKPVPGVSVNDLQKEIVKQILYILDPAKTPASRFARTSKFRWLKSVGLALLSGAVGVAVQWAITLAVALMKQDTTLTWRPDLYAPTLIGMALVTLLLLRITNGRLRISDLSAGSAKLTLADKDGSYFDDYLDEIVYFFQVSKTRILILEDMDRFNNVEVFEDLRALNVLLNHSAQLKNSRRRGKLSVIWDRIWKKEKLNLDTLGELEAIPPGFYEGPIIFVYAIRDSLFANTVEATGDVRHDAFTRTKFFDLIIPVVPFVTEQNARGALKTELELLAGSSEKDSAGSQARPSDDLVRQIAQYFPDQRQIRNIRNEFAMYRNRLLQPGSHPEELTPDRLLALVLYKNLEVADFERIRLGKSKLHAVQSLANALIEENLARINLRLSHPSEEAQRAQATALAERLAARTASLGVSFEKPVRINYGKAYYEPLSQEELSSVDLWRTVVAGKEMFFNRGKQINRHQIETAFDVSLDFAEKTAVPLTYEERSRLEKDREELEAATWRRLWDLPRFTLSSDSVPWDKVDGAVGEGDFSNGPLSFAQMVRVALGEGLASELIADGQLTKNFALFSAHFDPQFLGVEAQNFIQTAIGSPRRSPLTPVSAQAIREIIRDRTPLILERAGMVNIHVLHHLVLEAPQETHRVINQLRSWTPEDATFIRDYFNRYGRDSNLVALMEAVAYLAGLTSEIIPAIVNDESLATNRKIALFDGALGQVQADDFLDSVAGNEQVRHFAQQNHAQMNCLTQNDSASVAGAMRLAELQVSINDLTRLSTPARAKFVERGLFSMTVSNLRAITGAERTAWVTLEELTLVPAAYESILPRIKEYLRLLERLREDENATGLITVDSASTLPKILSDLETTLGEESLPVLRRVAFFASASATVPDIATCSTAVQEALLLEHRAVISTGNLLARLKSSENLSEGGATALHDQPTIEISDDADLSKFVAATLTSTKQYPTLLTSEVVISVLAHLRGQFEFPAEALLETAPDVAVQIIEAEWADLAALRAISDSSLGWHVREAMLAGKPVPNDADVGTLVGPEDVAVFLTCQSIEIEVRTFVKYHLQGLLDTSLAAQNADAIVEFFNDHNLGLELEYIHELTIAGALRSGLLLLLARNPAREAFSADPTTTLNLLGGEYAAITNMLAPSPKFDPTPENKVFLEVLADFGVLRHRAPTRDGMLRITRIGQ